jgi:hypothetical protein
MDETKRSRIDTFDKVELARNDNTLVKGEKEIS